MNVRLYFGAEMITFCIIHIGNRKIFLKHHSPPPMNVRLYFGAEMVTFCIIHIGNRKIFLKHHSPIILQPLPPLGASPVLP